MTALTLVLLRGATCGAAAGGGPGSAAGSVTSKGSTLGPGTRSSSSSSSSSSRALFSGTGTGTGTGTGAGWGLGFGSAVDDVLGVAELAGEDGPAVEQQHPQQAGQQQADDPAKGANRRVWVRAAEALVKGGK